jgi:hypothetical protein
MAIDAVAAAVRAGPAPRTPARPGALFRVSDSASPPQPAAEVALPGMLMLQEVEAPDQRDRAARRRGQELLAELAALQRALLAAGGDVPAALHRLAGLARAVPPAADPALRQAVAAIVLRSRVELARYEYDNAKITSSPHR